MSSSAGSGLASNPVDARWLAKYLAPHGYTVELVPLHERILRLDCAIGLVRNQLLVVCEDALPTGVSEVLADWDRIVVSLDEAAVLAVKGVPLGPDSYVTDPAFRRIREQIEAHGIQIHYVDFAISRTLGGAFRCSTQPLLRR